MTAPCRNRWGVPAGRGAGARRARGPARPRSGGSPATNGTIMVLRERGIDLARHRASELDAGVLAAADLVLAMTADHIGVILAWERSASRRTFTLGGFVRALEAARRSGVGAGTP